MSKFLDKQRSVSHINPIFPMLSVLPAVFSIILLGLIPAVINVLVSFTDYNGAIEKMKIVWFENYVNIFGVLGEDIFGSLLNTFKYMLFTILPIQFFALLLAVFLNEKWLKGKNIFRAVFFMPSVLGVAVTCTIWLIMYDPTDGTFAILYRQLHKVFPFIPKSSSFLGDERMSLFYISVCAVWCCFGYSMAIYLAGLQGVPNDIYEAADLDGAGGFAKFFRVTLPLIWPAITICLWIAISGTLGMSEYVIFLTNGTNNTSTIGFYIYDMVMKATVNQGQAAAVSILFFLFTTTIMLLFNKYIRKSEVEM